MINRVNSRLQPTFILNNADGDFYFNLQGDSNQNVLGRPDSNLRFGYPDPNMRFGFEP